MGPAENERAERRQRVETMSRITIRPIGSPLPLGFAALGAASVVLSGVQLGWVPIEESHQAAVAVIAFAVPLQLLASVFGFLARDSVGGTGMGLVAGSWLVTGLLTLLSPTGGRSPTLGLLLFFAAAALMVPTCAAALGKVVAAIVMFGTSGRFALTGIYEFRGGRGWEHLSGWWGVGLCVVALYAALAFELEDTRRRTILPVLRHGVGRRAVQGGIGSELDRVELEAGVREQL
ncbi:MAG: GPR1/FUN34/YaaH family transporter [Actinomycetota bacterium]|nr:GPR1/FUN34/YaaH family transporter [Actinomycetota bacterium]